MALWEVSKYKQVPYVFSKESNLSQGEKTMATVGGGNSKIFGICIPKIWGRWTHFDEHIFQMGWNHQADGVALGLWITQKWEF